MPDALRSEFPAHGQCNIECLGAVVQTGEEMNVGIREWYHGNPNRDAEFEITNCYTTPLLNSEFPIPNSAITGLLVGIALRVLVFILIGIAIAAIAGRASG
jgi:hypothetical protein